VEKKEKLPFMTNIFYGMGDFGFSMNNSIITAFFAVFMVTVVGMQPGLVAIILFIGRSWDFVNDLLVGYVSDRTRSKFGTAATIPAVWCHSIWVVLYVIMDEPKFWSDRFNHLLFTGLYYL
jgi:Na+/melibiose symporter-like transporter